MAFPSASIGGDILLPSLLPHLVFPAHRGSITAFLCSPLSSGASSPSLLVPSAQPWPCHVWQHLANVHAHPPVMRPLMHTAGSQGRAARRQPPQAAETSLPINPTSSRTAAQYFIPAFSRKWLWALGIAFHPGMQLRGRCLFAQICSAVSFVLCANSREAQRMAGAEVPGARAEILRCTHEG